MEKPTPTIVKGNLLTETGRVKTAVQKKFKETLINTLVGERDHTIANDNSILIPLAVDSATGKQVYGRLTVTVTALDTFSVKSGKKAGAEVVEVPDLDL